MALHARAVYIVLLGLVTWPFGNLRYAAASFKQVTQAIVKAELALHARAVNIVLKAGLVTWPFGNLKDAVETPQDSA